MKNLKEFINLIFKYESITIEQIEAAEDELICLYSRDYMYADVLLQKLITGFGRSSSCTLCFAVDNNCDECEWSSLNSTIWGECHEGDNDETYAGILNAKNKEDLLVAYQARAKYMREFLSKKGIEVRKV